jgi:hypothetical protein
MKPVEDCTQFGTGGVGPPIPLERQSSRRCWDQIQKRAGPYAVAAWNSLSPPVSLQCADFAGISPPTRGQIPLT